MGVLPAIAELSPIDRMSRALRALLLLPCGEEGGARRAQLLVLKPEVVHWMREDPVHPVHTDEANQRNQCQPEFPPFPRRQDQEHDRRDDGYGLDRLNDQVVVFRQSQLPR